MLPTLIIHLGATNTRAFLFSPNAKSQCLVDYHEDLSLKDSSLMVGHLKHKFKGRFEQIKIISKLRISSDCIDEDEVFMAGCQLFSKLGEVLVIDLGSEKTNVGVGNFGRVNSRNITLGSGVSAGKIMRQIKIEQLASVIPFAIDLIDIQNYLGKKTLYPGFAPYSREELTIELVSAAAILTEAKKAVEGNRLTQSPRFCLLSGAPLGGMPVLGQALFSFLQGWQPQGVVQVYLDPQGLLYPLALMRDYESFLSQFINLGTVISVNHHSKDQKPLGEISLDLGLDEKLKAAIQAGELLRVPFREGGVGVLEVALKKGASVGNNLALKQEIDGGELGIVVDARGRPIPPVPLNKDGREKVKSWIEALSS